MKKKNREKERIYVTEAVWPAKPKIFTPCPFWKRFEKLVLLKWEEWKLTSNCHPQERKYGALALVWMPLTHDFDNLI